MTIESKDSAVEPQPRRAMALDIVPALMLAAAVGFIAAVAPVDLIERLVVLSGLPSVLSAASPPLGFTARAIMVAGSSAATLGAAWLLLSAAGRRRPAERTAEPVKQPRLRTADRHPDAPARRPFSAREALTNPAVEPPALIAEIARPLEQRTIAELISTLESRLCGRAGDMAEGDRLQRGHG